MSGDLTGYTALVTGSTAGLGLAIAEELGLRGARVALNYSRHTLRAQTALDRLRSQSIKCELFQASVIIPDAVETLLQDVTAALGPVDILVINATPDQPQKPMDSYEWDEYQSMLDFFVKSPFLLTRASLPAMRQRGWGRIINIGSEVVSRAPAFFSAYVAAKGAQEAWTRCMARELAPENITVNMVSPGWIPVERHDSVPLDEKNGYFEGIPMGRWGTPKDVAVAVASLASPAASFMTGQPLGVSGGVTIA